MKDTIMGSIYIIMGAVFVSLAVIPYIRDALKGQKTLNGKLIAIDHENKTLRIRYRIDRNTYHDTDYRGAVGFLSGKLPPIGLKLTVTVKKDDPYLPVSVLMIPGSPRITRKNYINFNKVHGMIYGTLLGSFFVFCGIMTLLGEF